MTTKPRRRWFRFSLRTFFIAVTIFGVWLGWNLKIVRERKAVLNELRMAAGEKGTLFEGIETQEQYEVAAGIIGHPENDHLRVPFVRRLLGDESYFTICIKSAIDRQLLGRLEVAFPEAEIYVEAFGKEESLEQIMGCPTRTRYHAYRDSLFAPMAVRQPNSGNIFKTGLIEKPFDIEGSK